MEHEHQAPGLAPSIPLPQGPIEGRQQPVALA